MANVTLLTAATATNSPPTAVKATGSITTDTVANLIDGETFSLNDGLGGSLVFVFNKTGGTTTTNTLTTGVGRYPVSLAGIATADEVRDAIITAVNGAPIAITASSGGAATVTLTNDYHGPHGNQPASETSASGTFAISGLTGGVLAGADITKLNLSTSRGNTLGDAWVTVQSTAGSGIMTATIRLWGWSPVATEWFPLGIGTAAAPDTARGVLNGGNAIGEIATDKLQHSEIVSGLIHVPRVYAEVTAIGGTSTAVTVRLHAGA